MRTLTITICLTFTILLRSVGVSWSADLQKYLTGYQRGDYATALREWTPFFEQRDAAIQRLLGSMNCNGQGVSQNNKIAVKWCKLSAEKGYAYL
tara:strand:- start:172 stop:453 length:282 start_codon:yes stop_codon:yes gene_type:complete